MKKLILTNVIIFTLTFGVTVSSFSQGMTSVAKRVPMQKVLMPPKVSKTDDGIGNKPMNEIVNTKSLLDDPILGTTRYDMQTNSSSQNRIYLHSDGTIGTIWTMSHDDSYTQRGTGYNYYNGSAWGAAPATRIENEKTGWASYAPLGASGEIVVSHTMTAGLKVCKRSTKGTGTWTQSVLPGPPAAVDISWPRMVTNGPNHNYVHIIALTYTAYENLDLALLYYRSLDGGQTWDMTDRIIEGMSSADYLGFKADNYAWAEPRGDTLCFTVGDSWTDQFIMKSTNNGLTWTKTVIWPCPYNFWAGADTTGTFWCPDGGSSVTLDKHGKAHVVFGLMRASGDVGGNKYWVPQTDGIVYWNEDMPQLTSLDWDTLVEKGNLIGWVKDTNIFYAPASELAHYYNSMTGFPNILVDNNDDIFVVWSAVCPYKDLDNYFLRHIYVRTGYENGAAWNDSIWELTSGFTYSYQECAFPSMSQTSNNRLHILFQADPAAGAFLWSSGNPGYQGQNSPTDNDMIYLNPLKTDVGTGFRNVSKEAGPTFVVSQNFPNPVKEQTSIIIALSKVMDVRLSLTNIMGTKVFEIQKNNLNSGSNEIVIDRGSLTPGIYFYTVKAGNESVTKKMVVE